MHTRLLPPTTTLVGLLAALITVLGSVVTTASPAQAAAPSYVALGDSYSSGVGTRDYIDDGTSCQRSNSAYPRLLADQKGYDLSFQACSGATIPSVTQQPARRAGCRHERRQRSRSAATTPGSPTCSPSARRRGGPATATPRSTGAQAYIRNALPGALSNLYADIATRAPSARVVVVGYPRVFMGEDCNAGTWFAPEEQTRLNQTADQLNGALATAASSRGFAFANPTDAFVGHARVRRRRSGSTACRARSARATTPTGPARPRGTRPWWGRCSGGPW